MSSGQDAGGAGGDAFDGDFDTVPPTGTKLVELRLEPRFGTKKKKGVDAHVVLWGAGFILALGLGGGGMMAVHSASNAKIALAQRQADASAQALQSLEGEMTRLKSSVDQLRTSAETAHQDESLRGLRHSVDSLRQEVDQVKTAGGNNLAQLSSKIDKAEHDPTPKLAEIVARLDKFDAAAKAQDGSSQRIAEVQTRIERLEKQVSSSMATGSIPQTQHAAAPAAPAPAAAAAPSKTTAKQETAPEGAPQKTAGKQDGSSTAPVTKVAQVRPAPMTIPGWSVRDVYEGMALVEQRGGELREIAPGEYLPGVGQIESIERRGRSWVVMTNRGVIE